MPRINVITSDVSQIFVLCRLLLTGVQISTGVSWDQTALGRRFFRGVDYISRGESQSCLFGLANREFLGALPR